MERENNKQVDQAWERLYGRLKNDGLLTNAPIRRHVGLPKGVVGWVACMVLFCIGAWGIRMLMGENRTEDELHSLYNHKSAATLVTTLDDGSIAYLDEHTSLRFPKHFQAHKREVFLQGNALFNVTGNKDRPFIVETEQVKIEVLGTVFNVQSMETFSLSVEHGEVKVTAKRGGQCVLIGAGETVELHNGELNTLLTVDRQQFENYMRRIQFKDERLADVIRVINKDTDGLQLEIEPGLEDRRLTVTFSDNSPSSMAQLICMALNLRCEQSQHAILISAPN